MCPRGMLPSNTKKEMGHNFTGALYLPAGRSCFSVYSFATRNKLVLLVFGVLRSLLFRILTLTLSRVT